MNHKQEFGYFPKGSREALICFEPGEVYADMHFGERSLASGCSGVWSWTTHETRRLIGSCSNQC